MKTTNMLDLAKVISREIEVVGKRAGEKVDEDLISEKELPYTYIEDDLILLKREPNLDENKLQKEYSSETAEEMSLEEILKLNTDRMTGDLKFRIHAMGFFTSLANRKSAHFMRQVSQMNEGTFLAPSL